jgi:hypothetical protein
LLLACSTGLEPVREDHFFNRAELLARLAEIQVRLDRVKPLLVADQGKSFQLNVVDRVSQHVAVVTRRLPERATGNELQAGAVGVNLASMMYDFIQLDADATYIGLGGVVHAPARRSRDALFTAMDQFVADPAWANRNVEAIERQIFGLALIRDNAADQLGNANFFRAGVESAAVTSGALGAVELSYGGAAAFTRLIQLMKAGGTELGALAVVAEGGGALAIRFAAAGRSIALTEVEIAALVDAGILSAASWSLMMMASGQSKRADPKRFQAWVDSVPTRPAETNTPALQYQAKHCGPKEYLVAAENGKQVWADGVRAGDAMLVEAKHSSSLERTPFDLSSKLPVKVQDSIRTKQLNELLRYAEVIRDPSTPAVGVEIVTNSPTAVRYFEELLRDAGLPGRVVVKP